MPVSDTCILDSLGDINWFPSITIFIVDECEILTVPRQNTQMQATQKLKTITFQ
jgi:hypothetical protein